MSIKRVLDAAELSSYAHLDEAEIKIVLKNSDYGFQKFIDQDFLQGYIAFDKNNQKDQVMVFRESTELEDWIANLKFLPIETKDGIFHQTYYEMLNDIRREIMKNIEDKNFVSLGFSQGASLSRLFSYLINKNWRDKKDIFTKYKSFSVSFEPAQESKTDNYNPYGIYTTRGNDPVPIVPLGLTGWNQSGKHVHLTGKRGNALIEPKRYKVWLDRASDTIMDTADRLNGEKVPLDHNIQRIKNDWAKPKNQEKIIKLAKSFGLK